MFKNKIILLLISIQIIKVLSLGESCSSSKYAINSFLAGTCVDDSIASFGDGTCCCVNSLNSAFYLVRSLTLSEDYPTSNPTQGNSCSTFCQDVNINFSASSISNCNVAFQNISSISSVSYNSGNKCSTSTCLCDSTSCGSYGTCLSNGLCICQSGKYPSIDYTSCSDFQGNCELPTINSTSMLVDAFHYTPDLNFIPQYLTINLQFLSLNTTKREIMIKNRNSQVCANWLPDTESSSYLSNSNPNNLHWFQSQSACKDNVFFKFPWNTISPCLDDGGDGNYYGLISVLSNVYLDNNVKHLNRKRGSGGISTVITETEFLIAFQQKLNVTSSAFLFHLSTLVDLEYRILFYQLNISRSSITINLETSNFFEILYTILNNPSFFSFFRINKSCCFQI